MFDVHLFIGSGFKFQRFRILDFRSIVRRSSFDCCPSTHCLQSSSLHQPHSLLRASGFWYFNRHSIIRQSSIDYCPSTSRFQSSSLHQPHSFLRAFRFFVRLFDCSIVRHPMIPIVRFFIRHSRFFRASIHRPIHINVSRNAPPTIASE